MRACFTVASRRVDAIDANLKKQTLSQHRRTRSLFSPVLNDENVFEFVARRLIVVLHIGPVLVMCTFLH